MSYFDFHGSKVYYQIIENKEASQTVALLHGNAASSKMFAPVLSHYKKHYKILLIDFLGYGKSDRIDFTPDNIWHYESEQLISLVETSFSQKITLIGTSGGALVALNALCSRRDLFRSVVADSFMGFETNEPFITYLKHERAEAKKSWFNRLFFRYQHGKDWESVAEKDTQAILKNANEEGCYIKGNLADSLVPILFTASLADPFIQTGSVVEEIKQLVAHNASMSYWIFEQGGHPAMISNAREFEKIVAKFIEQKAP